MWFKRKQDPNIKHLDKDGCNHLCVAIEDLNKFHVDKNI